MFRIWLNNLLDYLIRQQCNTVDDSRLSCKILETNIYNIINTLFENIKPPKRK